MPSAVRSAGLSLGLGIITAVVSRAKNGGEPSLSVLPRCAAADRAMPDVAFAAWRESVPVLQPAIQPELQSGNRCKIRDARLCTTAIGPHILLRQMLDSAYYIEEVVIICSLTAANEDGRLREVVFHGMEASLTWRPNAMQFRRK